MPGVPRTRSASSGNSPTLVHTPVITGTVCDRVRDARRAKRRRVWRVRFLITRKFCFCFTVLFVRKKV